jgi:ubiquinone/menaquinone biosynthesis C-methylase UbiE
MSRRLAILPVVLIALLSVGRVGAHQLASRTTEDWIKTLEAPARIASLRIDEVVARLKVTPGQTVADLGAGTGAFSLPLAKAVGPSGKVYAVEIDRGLGDYIAKKAAEARASNVHVIIGKPTDPALPESNFDLAFMNDVLHHVEDRAGYLKQAARYLKSGGRFVVIEPEPGKGPHAGTPSLELSKDQVTAWMKGAGLTPVENVSLFTDRWFVIYKK